MKEQDCIKNIRKHIEGGNMSFIIGAGFSKNISSKFLSWNELLRPMIYEMYTEQMSRSPKKNKFAIQNIINEKGYLEIASEYIKRKGYHEAIDVYIENLTPYLVKQDDGSYVVMCKGKCVDQQPFLECHKKLMSLGVKNIYTFNYDNALDVFGETEIADESFKEQDNAALLIQRYEKDKDSYRECLNLLKEEIETMHSESQKASSTEIFDTLLKKVNEKIETFKLELTPFSNQNTIDGTFTKNIALFDTAIAKQKSVSHSAEMRRDDVYQLITNSFQISLTENNHNLYKLHGNLRLPNSQKFGFDNDTHKQYIICKEDYEEYASKHDAFVNLMKISLLRGTFCIIGFSCDDPNFLMWIDWVKDVLDKSKKDNDHYHANPIFFINVEKEPIPEDKLLLLQNHYITPLNLYCLFPSAKDSRQRMLSFLESIEMDKTKYIEYNNAWDKINLGHTKELITESIIPYINRVYELTKYNRISAQANYSHYKRTDVFNSADKLINQGQYTTETAKLIYAALKGELMPIRAVLNNSNIRQLLQSKDMDAKLNAQYKLLVMRSRILQHESIKVLSSIEDSEYECIWGKLFTFRFQEAQNMLSKWSPNTTFNCVRKQMLLSVFNSTEIPSDQVLSLLNQDNFDCIQDYKYALDILPQIRGIVFQDDKGHASLDKDVRKLKDLLEFHNPDLIEIWKTIDYLLNDICKPDEKHPYGNVRHSYKFSSYNSELVNATKILQILIELGIPTESRNLIFIDKNKWMIVCENLYEYYPYPCLYFTLLYGNSKDVIRKVAQNYIYNTELYSILPTMLNEILQSSLDPFCPNNIKEAIYIAAPIFMQAVIPEKWFDSFKKVYDSFNFTSTNPNRDRIRADYDFFIKSLKLTHNIEFKKQVVIDCLNKQSDVDNFYNEMIIAASTGIDSLGDIVNDKVMALMNNANTPAQFYVLLNMRQFVNNDTLCHKFLALPDNLYNDITLLNGVSWFAKDYPVLQTKLRDVVINSSLLWRTGISEDHKRITPYSYVLDINLIQNDIEFNEMQIGIIYDKMLVALNAISDIILQSNKRLDPFNNWVSILTIMLQFLCKNKKILDKKLTYIDTRKKVENLYYQNRGGAQISTLLIDDDHTGDAIESLVKEIVIGGVSKSQYEYMLIANKIILCNSQYLNSCFKHFAWALTEYENQFNQKIFYPLLKSILDLYKPYFLHKKPRKWDIQYAEKNIVEKELIAIYKIYAQWSGKSTFWAKYKPIYYFPSQ